MVRRRRPATKEVADLYARLRAVETQADNLENVTAIRFKEVQQDLNRLDSNADTQKKVMGQELARVEEQAETALQRTEWAQTQIDSLRQQTSDMHTSLTSIHEHSATLTQGLQRMMESFRDLRFDVPNLVDNWMKVKLGAEGAGTGTVSGSQLHYGSADIAQQTLPQLPPMVGGVTASVSASDGANTENTPHTAQTPPPHTPVEPPSPNNIFGGFIVPDSNVQSDAMMDLENRLDTGGMDVDGEVAQESSAMMAQEYNAATPVSTSASTMGDGGLEGNVRVAEGHLGERDRLSPLSPTPVPEAVSLPSQYPHLSPISSLSPTPQKSQAAEAKLPEGLQGNEVLEERTPPPSPPQQGPHSTSTSIIREGTVSPPPGLLVESSMEVCPPSSQSNMPSPAAHPDFRLLNAPSTAGAVGDEGVHQGRITRSRSRSVTHPPPQPSRSATPSKRKGKKPGSRR